MTPRLSQDAIQTAVDKLPGWSLVDKKLSKTFHFFDFREAMTFINKVAERAESHQHHPDIHLYYNKVVLELSTHDAGGITEKDIQLAQELDPHYS